MKTMNNKKFICKIGEKEHTIEKAYGGDVCPVIIAKDVPGDPVDEEKLYSDEDYKGQEIFKYEGNIYDNNKRTLKPVVYYYIGAKQIDGPKYKGITCNNTEDIMYGGESNELLIEVTLMDDRYSAKVYKTFRTVNMSMMEFMDDLADEIYEDLKDDDDYACVNLYDRGGWELPLELDNKDHLLALITGVRLVERV